MKLRYLHISDLHINHTDWQVGDANIIPARKSLSLLLEKISSLTKQNKKFDFIIITGDLVWSGKKEEFEAAEDFCVKLLKAAELSADRLYLIPGNHDIDRTEVKSSHVKRWYCFENQEEISEVLSDPDLFPILMRKFENFNQFSADITGRSLFSSSAYHYIESLTLEKNSKSFKINLLGLNSALFAGYDGDNKQLLSLGEEQVRRGCNQLDESALFSIGFFHHPFNCYHPSDNKNHQLIQEKLDLLLTGKMLKEQQAFSSSITNNCYLISSGNSSDNRDNQQFFNCQEIDLTNGNGRVDFYSFDNNHWKPIKINSKTKDGHFPFIIKKIKDNPVALPLTNSRSLLDKKLGNENYDLIISYSKKDSAWVKDKIFPCLENYSDASGNPLNILYIEGDSIDKEEIARNDIAQKISFCRYFIPVFSDSFFNSEFFRWQIEQAYSRDIHLKENFIIPIARENLKVPFEYRYFNYLNWSEKKEQTELLAGTELKKLSNPNLKNHFTAYQFKSKKIKTGQVHFIHDYALPVTFTGRAEEQARLLGILNRQSDQDTGKKASVVTICAEGGMGKSCIARKTVEALRNSSRFKYIIWFSFYEALTEDDDYFFKQIFSCFGSDVQLDLEKNKNYKTKELREKLCRLMDQIPVMLILDGLELIQETKNENSPYFGQIKSSQIEIEKLLSHLCNQNLSSVLITSRLPMQELSGISGYLEIELKRFSIEASSVFLKRIGVEGDDTELRNCAEFFGGHPLCLKTAGNYMRLKKIPARDVKKLIGNDSQLFKKYNEEQKVTSIVNEFRKDLSLSQEHFLKMMSLHPRAVDDKNFPILIKGYNHENKEQDKKLISELKQKGLIDEVKNEEGKSRYNTHPLMKGAFSTWLNNPAGTDKEAINKSSWIPYKATSLKELTPYLEAMENYLKLGNIEAAWEIYSGRHLDRKLFQLGYAKRSMEYGKSFVKAFEDENWQPGARNLVLLYEYLARACYALLLNNETINYCEKQFYAARMTGERDKVLIYGSILSQMYITMGAISKARYLLKQLEKLAKPMRRCDTRGIYYFSVARMYLFCGKYSQTIKLLEEPLELRGYNLVLQKSELGEALMRSGELKKAEIVLKRAYTMAKTEHINNLLPEILDKLTLLSLKRWDLNQARNYDSQKIKIKKSLGLPSDPNELLLVREGHFEQAIKLAEKYISSSENEKIDRASEIEGLLVLAESWRGKRDSQQAEKFLKLAENLQNETGCFRNKDYFEEIRQLIENKNQSATAM